MRMNKVVTVSIFIFITSWACSPKAESSTESANETDTEEWKGMDDFHVLMAKSFHPYRDSANVEPAKQLASEMITSAQVSHEQI